MTFKESVQSKLIIAANEYKRLIGIDFIIKSNHFKINNEYLIRFHNDNFLHLTGVITSLSANDFFKKCINETITADDFVCDISEELKGKVKEKLRNLSTIGDFFNRDLVFQEMFEKNRVKCKIATSDGKYTLGFICIKKEIYVPLTLLNKNQIDINAQITDFTITKINR